MQKPVYFLSDVHLGAPGLSHEFETLRKEEMLKFLDGIMRNGSRLTIVGDLFDFWYEYRYVIPKDYFWIYTKLNEMVQKGLSVDYVAGNHDFFLGQFFAESLGLRVYQDGFSEEIDGKKFLIIHGDGLAQNDSGYRLLKKVLRTRSARALIRWIHPDVGFHLAKVFSKKSREYTSSKDYGETDSMMSYAERRISEGYDFVVMGHNHVPKLERFDKGVYINLGDWIKNFTYGVFDGETMKLLSWKVET